MDYAVPVSRQKSLVRRNANTLEWKRRGTVIGKFVIGACIIFIFIFPIYWLLLISFQEVATTSGAVALLPQSFTLEHYKKLFLEKGFDVAMKNSLVNASVAMTLSLIFGITTSYILARRRFDFRMRGTFISWILLVRVLPPVAFVVPLYILFTNVGLMGTRIPIIMSCMLINIPLIVWFIITFFQELPESVEESGKIDGATEWQLFYKVVLPLVLPGIAAVSMLSFMYAWNEYTYSIILTRSPSNYTVPLALGVLNTEDNVTNFGLVAAGGVCSFLPISLFVIFAQNYLISGLSSGAVKE